MRKRLRRGTDDLGAILLELAPVAGAFDLLMFGVPRSDATKMGAHRRDGVKPFRHPNDLHLLILKKCDGVNRIEIWIAGAERGRRLKKDVGRKILIGDSRRTEPRDSERAERDLVQEIAPCHSSLSCNR